MLRQLLLNITQHKTEQKQIMTYNNDLILILNIRMYRYMQTNHHSNRQQTSIAKLSCQTHGSLYETFISITSHSATESPMHGLNFAARKQCPLV